MFNLIQFIYFISIGLILNNFNYLYLILFILVFFVSSVWKYNEKWFFFTLTKINQIEVIYLILLISILFVFLCCKINFLWVVFLLEFQSFMILGSCYLFKNESIKVKEIEGSLNYIFPAFLSFVLLLIFVLGISLQYTSIYYTHYLINIVLLISIITKVGAFPLFFWVPNVFSGITYSTLLFLSIISKIFMILIIIQYVEINNPIIIISGLLSISISCIYMMNQTKIKKFLAFSSIANIGWILVVLITFKSELVYKMNGIEILILFFFLYSFNLILFCIIAKGIKKSQLLNLFSTINTEKTSILLLFLLVTSLFSMAGIPPFSGFIGKFIVITYLNEYNLFITLLLVILSSFFIFIYIRPIIFFYKNTSPHSSLLIQKNIFNKNNYGVNLLSSFFVFFNIIIMYLIFHIFF